MSHAQALISQPIGASLASLDTFVSQVKNDQPAEVRGVYIPDILAAAVLQQPAGNYGFVSPRPEVVTQFDLAARAGSTGLLAHNNLAGESFSLIKKQQKFYLVYGDGKTAAFIVTEVLRYQALEPTNVAGDLKDLQNGNVLTAAAVFSKVYERPGQVILQTCIAMGGNLSWGRLFVIAEPYSEDLHSEVE